MSRRRTAALPFSARARIGRGPGRAGPRRPGQARHVLQRRRQGHRLRERRHRLRGGDRREGSHRGGRVDPDGETGLRGGAIPAERRARHRVQQGRACDGRPRGGRLRVRPRPAVRRQDRGGRRAGHEDPEHVRARAAAAEGRPRQGLRGGDGIVLTDFGKRYQGANAVVVYPNGNIAAGGFASNGSTGRWAIARYGPKRCPRQVLGQGRTRDGRPEPERRVDPRPLFVPGGKLIGVGYAESGLIPRFAVARFRPKGTLDPDFGDKGFNLTDVSKGSDIGYGGALQSDGKIVVVGYANNAGKADWGLVRYGPKGRLDQHFGGDGKVITKMTTEYEFASAVAVQANGKLVVVGRASREGTGRQLRRVPLSGGRRSWTSRGAATARRSPTSAAGTTPPATSRSRRTARSWWSATPRSRASTGSRSPGTSPPSEARPDLRSDDPRR